MISLLLLSSLSSVTTWFISFVSLRDDVLYDDRVREIDAGSDPYWFWAASVLLYLAGLLLLIIGLSPAR